jgi:hypothetical protein
MTKVYSASRTGKLLLFPIDYTEVGLDIDLQEVKKRYCSESNGTSVPKLSTHY